MTDIAGTNHVDRELRNARILIALAVAGVLAALMAGAVLLIADPTSGSNAEAALGLTAAIGGLSAAVFAVAAAIYAQVKNLWRYAPTWLRVAASIVVLVAVATTLWSWATQTF